MSIRAFASVSTFEVTSTSSSESEQSNSSVDLCMSFRGSRCTSALIDMIRTFVLFTNNDVDTVFLAFSRNMECIFWFLLYIHHHMCKWGRLRSFSPRDFLLFYRPTDEQDRWFLTRQSDSMRNYRSRETVCEDIKFPSGKNKILSHITRPRVFS